MIANQHSRGVQVHPGLTSWGILSRPCGTCLGGDVHPRTNVLGYSQVRTGGMVDSLDRADG
jgi:hypothetical protein